MAYNRSSAAAPAPTACLLLSPSTAPPLTGSRGAAAPYTAYKHNMRSGLPRQRTYLTSKYSAQKVQRPKLHGSIATCTALSAQPPHTMPISTKYPRDLRARFAPSPHRFLTIQYPAHRAATRRALTRLLSQSPLSAQPPPPYPHITWPGWPTCSQKPHIH